MSFGVWFKNWIRAFCKLLTFDYKKPKSDAQRKRERIRRLKAKHSSANFYRTKKKYKRRRSSISVQNEKLLNGLLGFFGASLGILLLPLGLFDWGRKSIKAKRASKSSSVRKMTTPKHATTTLASRKKKKHHNYNTVSYHNYGAYLGNADNMDTMRNRYKKRYIL